MVELNQRNAFTAMFFNRIYPKADVALRPVGLPSSAISRLEACRSGSFVPS
jgi:hypothetical protein